MIMCSQVFFEQLLLGHRLVVFLVIKDENIVFIGNIDEKVLISDLLKH